jgi:hypothetical protein
MLWILVEREFTEVSLELVIALVEKDSLVPGPTIPVLVRDRGVLADANIMKIHQRGDGVTRKNTWDAKVAGSIDERSSKRKNFTWSKSDVEGGRDSGSSARQDVEDRLVTSLHGQDGASRIKEDRVGNERGPTKVSSNTNRLYHSCCSSHGGDISEGRVKLELATCNGLLPK